MPGVGPYRRSVARPTIGKGRVFTATADNGPPKQDITRGQAAALKNKLNQEYQKVTFLNDPLIMNCFFEKLSAATASLTQGAANYTPSQSKTSLVKNTTKPPDTNIENTKLTELPSSSTEYRSQNSTDRLINQKTQYRA